MKKSAPLKNLKLRLNQIRVLGGDSLARAGGGSGVAVSADGCSNHTNKGAPSIGGGSGLLGS